MNLPWHRNCADTRRESPAWLLFLPASSGFLTVAARGPYANVLSRNKLWCFLFFRPKGDIKMTSVVIDTSYDVRWREPVWVKVGYGTPEPVRGPRQALNYLAFRWPAIRGDHFRRAQDQCIGALKKEFPCEQAREAFIGAVTEAGMWA